MTNKPNETGKQIQRKIPLGEVLKLHLIHNHSLASIGRRYGCSRQYISKLVKPFKDLIQDPETLDFYRKARPNMLTAAEMKIIENLVDDKKLKDASANNLAYCFQQIHAARRLEEGLSPGSSGNVNIDKMIVQILDDGLRGVRKSRGGQKAIDAEFIPSLEEVQSDEKR